MSTSDYEKDGTPGTNPDRCDTPPGARVMQANPNFDESVVATDG